MRRGTELAGGLVRWLLRPEHGWQIWASAYRLLPLLAEASPEEFLARGPPRPFDLVLLDPPFDSSALTVLPAQLEAGGWLAPGACIYVEHSKRAPLPALPAAWTLHRSGIAGEVGYHLFHHV